MTEKTITCITCPIGCNVTVRGRGGRITSIEGNKCKRGEEYVSNEYLDPRRVLTTVVKSEGCRLPVISVRTDKPIPKDKILNCVEELRTIVAKGDMRIGDVLVENILGTGANIIVTKNMREQ